LVVRVLELVADDQGPALTHEISDARSTDDLERKWQEVVVAQVPSALAEKLALGVRAERWQVAPEPRVPAEGGHHPVGECVERMDLDLLAHVREGPARAAGDFPHRRP